jgi:hypothetical protein
MKIKSFLIILAWITPLLGIGQISGSNSINSGVTTYYSIPSTSGANYFWSSTGGITILSGQGTNRIGVRGSSNGKVCVTRYSNNTEPFCDCKSITVSTPPSCSVITPTFHVLTPNWNTAGETCPNYSFELSVNDLPPTSLIEYEWVIQGANILYYTGSKKEGVFVRSGGVGTILYFKVRARYTCGTSDWSIKQGIVVSCGGSGGGGGDIPIGPLSKDKVGNNLIKVYPNPSSNNLQVAMDSSIKTSEVFLYNEKGNLVLKRKVSSANNYIDTSEFPSGLYTIKVIGENFIKEDKIIISH